VDSRSGLLTPAGHTPTGGKTPRNFAVDPTGRFLLVANQRSDSVVTFRIDSSTGALSPTGHAAEIPSPVCLKLTAPF
jgi:6-phosphogluconolactonase